MRVAIIGNSGSGKSTLARRLAGDRGLPTLDLDTVAWEPNKIAVPRAPADAIADVKAFCEVNRDWVIEGCYAGLIHTALQFSPTLLFLEPGVDACLANCRSRPWEPHKYQSKREQDEKLQFLFSWVREYYSREGDLSLVAHQALFDGYQGPKHKLMAQVEENSSMNWDLQQHRIPGHVDCSLPMSTVLPFMQELLEFREAGLEDVDEIARVESDTKRECELSEPAIYDVQRLQGRWDAYVRCLRHPQHAEAPRILFVATMNRQMVGFIAGHFSRRYETEGELQSIHVLKNFQRIGVGSELLRRIAAWFVAHKRRTICVGIDPASPYSRFYEKHSARYINKHWLVWDDIARVLEEQTERGPTD